MITTNTIENHKKDEVYYILRKLYKSTISKALKLSVEKPNICLLLG